MPRAARRVIIIIMDRQKIYGELPEKLLPWYDAEKRDLPWRADTDPYRVWISEIMLQQTRVEAAREHYLRFMRELPDVQALAACPEDRLMKLWEGLGYYSRARNLQKAARKIVETGGFPADYEGLLKLSGVGQYTAGAIASIAFSQPVPAVDGNVIRALSRIFADERPPETLKKVFTDELGANYPKTRCGDFTQSLMELGATVCLPRSPKCLFCPVFGLCGTRSDRLPLMPEKRPRKRADMTVFIFSTPRGIGLCRRKEGVLKGMWQFYNAERKMTAAEAEEFLKTLGIADAETGRAHFHKHIFTHIEWAMTAYVVRTATLLPELSYFPAEEIGEKIALPSAFRWCMDLLP